MNETSQSAEIPLLPPETKSSPISVGITAKYIGKISKKNAVPASIICLRGVSTKSLKSISNPSLRPLSPYQTIPLYVRIEYENYGEFA